MTQSDRTRAMLGAGVTLSLVLAAAAFTLWRMSDTLAFAYDHHWIAPLLGLLALPGIWYGAAAHQFVRRRWIRRSLGLAALMTAGVTLISFVLLLDWSILGEELSRTTISTSIGVDVDHVVVQQGFSPNTCQFLDLRRSSGPFRRHRVATRCVEADGAVWKVDIDGRVITLSNEFKIRDRVERWACSYEIDPASLRLRSMSSDSSCDAYLS